MRWDEDSTIARGLEAMVTSGEALLFTGAGFSSGACDIAGAPLPDSEQMRRELWRMLFGDDEPDDSTLQDLYDVARERAPADLARYVSERLRVGRVPNIHRYAAWFSLPWRRIYTLNVDDLEAAVARELELPRRLRSISALAGEPAPPPPGDALEVVHLNGIAADGPETLTFSTLQYAARLCEHDREYLALANDLARWPFVFVGTTLDEVVLWQHLELHRRGSGRPAPARPSYLISRTLSRARRLLLEDLGLIWIPATIEQVSAWLEPWLDS